MADRRSNHSGHSGDRPRSVPLGGNGNGIKEGKGKSHQESFHLQDTDTTMSTSAEGGDGVRDDNKKVAWETMLPSKKSNTIGNNTKS